MCDQLEECGVVFLFGGALRLKVFFSGSASCLPCVARSVLVVSSSLCLCVFWPLRWCALWSLIVSDGQTL